MVFKQQQCAKDHFDVVHLGKTIKCNVCDKSFTLRQYLALHLKNIHGQANWNTNRISIQKRFASFLEDRLAIVEDCQLLFD